MLLDYEYSEKCSLDTKKIRTIIEENFKVFEKHQQGCPVELFESLCTYFHSISQDCPSHCYTHNVFGYEYCEETSCDCQQSFGEKLYDNIIRTYATELFQLSQNLNECQLDLLIGRSLASQSHTCPCLACGKVKFTKKLIMQIPKVLIISVTWSDVNQRVMSWLIEGISPVLLLRNLFSLSSEQAEYFSRYIFKGLVGFTASHYISFFYSLRRNAWIQFDDSTVRVLDNWSFIVQKLILGKVKPVLLVYELDSELDKFKREYQLEYIEKEQINYLLDPDVYFESFNDVLSLDLAGLTWKSELTEMKTEKKCEII